jgi:hypothetical protein
MKELHGTASELVTAPVRDCMALLTDVEGYPKWYPEAVKSVTVLDRDDHQQATRAQTLLHVVVGPIVQDFDLVLAVEVEPSGIVELTRIAHGPRDGERFKVTWRCSDAAPGTRVGVALDASLSVPRFLPLGGVGDLLARGFVGAAARALTPA